MNTNQRIVRSVVIFVSMTISGIGVAIGALVVPDPFAQSIMVSIGSTMFGAGLTFFLIRMVTILDK